ncbi:homeobox-domain-containing protein [Rhizopus microsporus var. microsporus]|uniref:Homeobox-domain-containing protein n=1 Tax=Rhizopus microsporus var. microsporus TaxID=86635 RepID=A0A1X0RGM4_RHIZD|nr:homeobox-domain-containing protein [Rhizopus microsporus var. microsporus]
MSMCINTIQIMDRQPVTSVFYENRRSSGTIPNFTPNFYNPFEVKHRRRTSREQTRILEKAFNDNPKPNGKSRERLAQLLSMSPRGVQIWFQNRRAKAKSKQQQDRKQGAIKQSDDTSNDGLFNTFENFTATVSSDEVLSTPMVYSHSQSSLSSFAESLASYDQAQLSIHSPTLDANARKDSSDDIKKNSCTGYRSHGQQWDDNVSFVTEEKAKSKHAFSVPSFVTSDELACHSAQLTSADQDWWVSSLPLSYQNIYDAPLLGNSSDIKNAVNESITSATMTTPFLGHSPPVMANSFDAVDQLNAWPIEPVDDRCKFTFDNEQAKAAKRFNTSRIDIVNKDMDTAEWIQTVPLSFTENKTSYFFNNDSHNSNSKHPFLLQQESDFYYKEDQQIMSYPLHPTILSYPLALSL